MNWDAISAIGEILGATAVLGTLAYLAAQVRQNVAAAAAATYDSALSGFNEINLAIADNAKLTDIFSRGLYDPESLDETEAVRFAFLCRAASNQYLKLLRLWQREAMGGEAGQIYPTPGGQAFRRQHANYADLFEEVDLLDTVDTTDFLFKEGKSGEE